MNITDKKNILLLILQIIQKVVNFVIDHVEKVGNNG